MTPPIGSNTSNPSGASATTVTFDTVKTRDGDQFTFLEDTPSTKNNTKPGSDSETVSPASDPPTFKQPCFIAPLDLPSPILAAIGGALGTAHFALWIPNSAGAFITPDSIADIPPGSAVVLVFPETPGEDLPTTHNTGDLYILNTRQ